MFKNKHRRISCRMLPDNNTDHDFYSTYVLTKKYKTIHLISLTMKLNKLHTPHLLRDIIVNSVDKYYNNRLIDDLPEFTITPLNHNEIKKYTHLQSSIDWDHFMRGSIFTLFYPVLKSYFRSNQLGRRHTSYFWFRSIIPFIWDPHHIAWKEYCNSIHSLDTMIHKITTAKSILLNLAKTYILEAVTLPRYKKIFFSCKASKYTSWSITKLKK